MKLDGIGIFVSDMRTMVEFYKISLDLKFIGMEKNQM